jgi:hypothetical protein
MPFFAMGRKTDKKPDFADKSVVASVANRYDCDRLGARDFVTCAAKLASLNT